MVKRNLALEAAVVAAATTLFYRLQQRMPAGPRRALVRVVGVGLGVAPYVWRAVQRVEERARRRGKGQPEFVSRQTVELRELLAVAEERAARRGFPDARVVRAES